MRSAAMLHSLMAAGSGISAPCKGQKQCKFVLCNGHLHKKLSFITKETDPFKNNFFNFNLLYRIFHYLCKRKTNNGTLAEWLGNGLQNRVQRFESARYLQTNAGLKSGVFVWRYFYLNYAAKPLLATQHAEACLC